MLTHYHQAMHSGPAQPPRIAFFGGSFDPPHKGHLAIARAAYSGLHLDQVLFAPVGAQPLKPHGASASFNDRLAMTRLCIEDDPAFAISLEDAPSAEPHDTPHYTIETLRRLRASLPPNATLLCLIGADSFRSLRHWHRGAEIPFVAPLIVAARPGQKLDDLSACLPPGLVLSQASRVPESIDTRMVHVFQVSAPHGDSAPLYLLPDLYVDISASQIREALERGASAPAEFLTPQVAEYIHLHGLYRDAFTCEPPTQQLR